MVLIIDCYQLLIPALEGRLEGNGAIHGHAFHCDFAPSRVNPITLAAQTKTSFICSGSVSLFFLETSGYNHINTMPASAKPYISQNLSPMLLNCAHQEPLVIMEKKKAPLLPFLHRIDIPLNIKLLEDS